MVPWHVSDLILKLGISYLHIYHSAICLPDPLTINIARNTIFGHRQKQQS
jgi:hypothetical protein